MGIVQELSPKVLNGRGLFSEKDEDLRATSNSRYVYRRVVGAGRRGHAWHGRVTADRHML